MSYVVRVMRGYTGPQYEDHYLGALRYDPYCRGDYDRSHSTTSLQYEAFRFRTLAAAEVAAVFVGGRVVKLRKKAAQTAKGKGNGRS